MSEKELKLEDLIPNSSSFTIEKFKDFRFKLNPCTSGKLLEISNKLGDVEVLLSTPSLENISKIAIMLMEFDSAVKFKKQKVKTIDVLSGDESEIEIGGYLLLANSIQGITEQFNIYGAILRSFGYNKDQVSKTIQGLKDSINGVVNDKIKNSLKKKKRVRKT